MANACAVERCNNAAGNANLPVFLFALFQSTFLNMT